VAVGNIVPVPGDSFEQTLASASPDVLREMIRQFAQRMMDAEVETVCGAGYGEVSAERVNSRNCKYGGVQPLGSRLTRPATGVLPCTRTVAVVSQRLRLTTPAPVPRVPIGALHQAPLQF
jgi:hypothetical protein